MAHIYALSDERRRTLDPPGRERYIESPKVMIRVGAGGSPGHETRVSDCRWRSSRCAITFAAEGGENMAVSVCLKASRGRGRTRLGATRWRG